jgi:hypothetical protein
LKGKGRESFLFKDREMWGVQEDFKSGGMLENNNTKIPTDSLITTSTNHKQLTITSKTDFKKIVMIGFEKGSKIRRGAGD